MATYYVSGSVTSASGSGSGTLGDPWVKTDDLIQYAFTQIAAGAGSGSAGDTIVVLDGTLTNTARLDPTVWSAGSGGNVKPLWIKAVDPQVIIDWDCGGNEFIVYPYNAVKLAGFRFYNFTDGGTGFYPFRMYRYVSFINCVFDGYAMQHHGLMSMSIYSAVIGCKFINDNRYNNTASQIGYACQMSTGVFKDNYFETTTTAGNPYYAFQHGGVHVVDNVFYNTVYYGNGYCVPTQGARFSNNTFYSDTSTKMTCIYNPASYENGNIIDNNYFEGWSNAVLSSPNRMCLEWITGNKGYDNSAMFNSNLLENNTTLYDVNDSYFENATLAQSGLVDAANKDFRPTSELIAKGFHTQAKALPNGSRDVKPNVGAVNGVRPYSFDGQYNPFGGN